MRIDLPPELEAMVREKVQSGLYHDPGAVVQEALHLLDERDRLHRLRTAVLMGVEQIERGEGRPYTAELRGEIHRAARRKVQEGKQPKADVVP